MDIKVWNSTERPGSKSNFCHEYEGTIYKEKRTGSDGKIKGLKERSQRQEKKHEDDSATAVK